MSQKNLIVFSILVLLFFPFISSDGADLISLEGVKYDSRIEGKFLYQDRVYVSINLKDESGIIFNGTTIERRAMLKPHDEWFQKRINETLKTISEEDFILHTLLPKGFGGFITKEGFEKFKQDERINSISLNDVGVSTLAESTELINADDAWSSGYTGEGVKVCVIDSGLITDPWEDAFNNI